MRKTILIFFMSFAMLQLFSQTQIRWQQVYGAGGVEAGYGVRSCLDQGYIAVGSSSASGPSDGYIVRTDSMGVVMWIKYYGGINIDVIRAIELLPDSGFIMAGYTNSYGYGGYDGWLLRTDKNGDTLWTKTLGTSNWDLFYDVEYTRDSGFLCTGGTYGLGNGDEDMYLCRFDKNGDTLWTKTYGGAFQDEARAVVETEDSLLAISGFTYSLNDTLGESQLLRLSSIGDVLWTRTLGDSTFEDKAYGLTYDPVFKLLIYSGYTEEPGNAEGYWCGVYYGDSAWFEMTAFGPNGFDCFYAVHAKPTLAPLAATGITSMGAGLGDQWLWTNIGPWLVTSFGTFSEDESYDFDFTHDGGFITCGITYGYNSFDGNMYLVKSDTNLQSTTVVNVPEIAPTGERTAVSVYPVPASNQISVTFITNASTTEDIYLELFDVQGKSVMLVPNGQIETTGFGKGKVNIDVESFPEGIYYYTLNNSNGTLYSDRFIIVR